MRSHLLIAARVTENLDHTDCETDLPLNSQLEQQ